MKDSETTQEIYVDADFIAAWNEYDVRHLAYDLDDAVWLSDGNPDLLKEINFSLWRTK